MKPHEIPESIGSMFDNRGGEHPVFIPPFHSATAYIPSWREIKALLAYYWPAIEAHILAKHGIEKPDPVKSAAREAAWAAIGGTARSFMDEETTNSVADTVYAAVIEAQRKQDTE